jgi:hypothetical protein
MPQPTTYTDTSSPPPAPSTAWKEPWPAWGLLDQALALDLRKPQDHFHRVWTTAFRATDLAATISTVGDEQEACA